jgi:hypothetical protein
VAHAGLVGDDRGVLGVFSELELIKVAGSF